LQTLLASHRAGANVGLYSVCCSNEQVLRAAMRGAGHGTVLLVEATSNQVDQFGGYTGMTPRSTATMSAPWPMRKASRASGSWAVTTSARMPGRSARLPKR
jgi:hypothetical protein